MLVALVPAAEDDFAWNKKAIDNSGSTSLSEVAFQFVTVIGTTVPVKILCDLIQSYTLSFCWSFY